MKRILWGFLLIMVCQISFSQKVYFVYLQSEQEQPFFVRMNDKVYSSTASGYLILSKLYDSSYSFNIGFPGNKWPEQKFSVFVNKRDHGYLLKNFADKGWGLFDLQSLSTQMAMPPEEKKSTTIKTEKKDVSEFTDILSRATDDSTLKEKQVLVKEEKKPDTIVQAVVKKEEVKPEEKPIVKNEEPKVENKEQSVIKPEETKISEEKYKKSIVTRKSESSTTAGVGLIFIDDYQNGKKDTLHILIPHPKSLMSTVKQEPKEEKKFLEVFTDTTKKEKENLPEIKKEEKTIVNQSVKNCSRVASGDDFLTLRKNMASKKDDDAMVNEGKKYFKLKCFTTSQIKNLSFLFLNDEGKYKFFDAAYNYTSDIENFSSLQSEIKDEYYINRFKAMLRN